jgi:AcrR family transcriptional regulator
MVNKAIVAKKYRNRRVKRRRKPSSQGISAIIRNAERLLGPDGDKKFTLTELARTSGFAASTFHHYFSSKKDLIDTLKSQVIEREAIGASTVLPPPHAKNMATIS